MPDREKIIKAVAEAFDMYWSEYDGTSYFDEKEWAENKRDALFLLKGQEEKTGHWIEKEDYNLDTYYDCSVCGESWTMIDGTPWENGMYYCPHCGAKMEGR